MNMKMWKSTAVIAVAAASLSAFAMGQSTQNRSASADKNPLHQLHFRPLGPIGNRTASIVGEPGNPLVIYSGSAAGGIFKTEDGGNIWNPVFDDQDVAAVGALAIAPSEPRTVWAGTGEPWLIRPFYPLGDGVYKSTNGGKSWQHVGLERTGHIARIVVHPHDPNIVYVCAVGETYHPQQERGIFRTEDGGKTWQQVLFVDQNTGCSDIAMDSHDSQTLFAGMWSISIKTWELNSGGTGSGVFVSHDGGTTWNRLNGHGLPAADHPLGKVAVAIAPSDSDRVYALVQDKTPGLYRSDDGGNNWKLINQSHLLTERSAYYTRVAVSPDNPDLLYFPSVAWSVSRDGGNSFAEDAVRASGDTHDVWIDPKDPSRILIAGDQGVTMSLNRGHTYQHFTLPNAQIYHVYTDTKIPYDVFGNRQDGEAYTGPSNNLAGSRGFFGSPITAGDWRTYGGCESGFGIPDPSDPDIVWSGCYDGGLARTDLRTSQARSVNVWPDPTYGYAPSDVKYRWHWTFPIAISPFDHSKVYVGSQFVHVTTNGGQTWSVISPDLTTNDKSHQQNSGGIHNDNLMTFDGSTLYAIAESPKQQGVIWTGSNDGQVNISRDGGKNWNNVTKHITGLPPWGIVMNIEPSKYDAGTAYIAVDLQQSGDYGTYVYKTTDFGETWKPIGSGVPKSLNATAKCVREDPVRKGMLYLGTNNGLYVSWNDGADWSRLRNNLPPSPVYWITVEPRFHDLVLATYGRGIYVLDDITPLRDWDKAEHESVHLFSPRTTYRLRDAQVMHASEAGHVIGENPAYGADINFSLQKAGQDWTLTIQQGDKTIRTMHGKGEAGLNRVWWDLRYDQSHELRMLTPPPDATWLHTGPEGWRTLHIWGTEGNGGPKIAPGDYEVKLTVGSQSLNVPLHILRDPGSLGTEADIKAATSFLLQLQQEKNQVTEMINSLERIRKRLEDLHLVAAQDQHSEELLKEAKDLDAKAVELEGLLIDVHLTGPSEDAFRRPMMLYEKIGNLEAEIGNTGADMRPTDQAIAVNNEWIKQIAELNQRLESLQSHEIAEFNQRIKAVGL